MKKIAVLITLALLTGCANMTPGQKTAAVIIGGIIVASAVASASNGPPKIEADKPCAISNPDPAGFTFVCP